VRLFTPHLMSSQTHVPWGIFDHHLITPLHLALDTYLRNLWMICHYSRLWSCSASVCPQSSVLSIEHLLARRQPKKLGATIVQIRVRNRFRPDLRSPDILPILSFLSLAERDFFVRLRLDWDVISKRWVTSATREYAQYRQGPTMAPSSSLHSMG
jgi:hypothetical protein